MPNKETLDKLKKIFDVKKNLLLSIFSDKIIFEETIARATPDCKNCEFSEYDKLACNPMLSITSRIIQLYQRLNNLLFAEKSRANEFGITIMDKECSDYSMIPTIERGDILIISKLYPFKGLKERDIISYISDENEIIHRLIKRIDGIFSVKGDNLKDLDDVYISPINYTGKVVKIIKKDDPLSNTIKSWRDL